MRLFVVLTHTVLCFRCVFPRVVNLCCKVDCLFGFSHVYYFYIYNIEFRIGRDRDHMVVELISTYLISIHSVSISRYNVNYVTVAKSPVCRWLPKRITLSSIGRLMVLSWYSSFLHIAVFS